MRLSEVKGNIIRMAEEGQVEAIVHGCNCVHAMGSGIAGQFARRYPEVPKADIDGSVFNDVTKLGTWTKAAVRSVVNPSIVFDVYNMYTQKRPAYDGADVFEYAAFQRGCEALADYVLDHPEYIIAFPKIGAGLAGGDWNRIRQTILDAFEHTNAQIVLVEWDGTNL